jgi:hypothetical protein
LAFILAWSTFAFSWLASRSSSICCMSIFVEWRCNYAIRS